MTVREALHDARWENRIATVFKEYLDKNEHDSVFRPMILILRQANNFIDNFEIGFKDPGHFYLKYEALVVKYIFPITARALFLRQSKILFESEAWKAATKNIVEFDTGYQGFSAPANSSFRKDKQTSESFINNPLIFAQALKDIFRDDIEKFINEVKLYCLEVY